MSGSDKVVEAIDDVLGNLRKDQDSAMGMHFDRYKHAWITDGLHPRVFRNDYTALTMKRLPVVWSDGTESPPFPLKCLSLPPSYDKNARPIRVGLISGRHPALDESVDYYLLRNREVDLTETSAEQEKLAYLSACDALEEFSEAGGGVLELHQTGLETVIVGFYRAFTELLLAKGRGLIWVVPRAFSPGATEIWLRESVASAIVAKVKSYPEYLAFKPTGKARGGSEAQYELRWLPEQPMTEEESDILIDHFGSLATDLFHKSLPRKLEVWG